MKTLRGVFLIVVAAIFLTTQAQAVLFFARPYDPNLARWITRDPVGERGGNNLYVYVDNNPINKTDPLGLWGVAFGNNSGSHYLNIGWGNPSLYFSPSSYRDLGNGIKNVIKDPVTEPIGGAWALAGLALGSTLSSGHNAVQVENHPLEYYGDITLGHFICYKKGFGPNAPTANGPVGNHEEQHTYQEEALGPLYLPYYGIGAATAYYYSLDPVGPGNFMEYGPYSKPPTPWGE